MQNFSSRFFLGGGLRERLFKVGAAAGFLLAVATPAAAQVGAGAGPGAPPPLDRDRADRIVPVLPVPQQTPPRTTTSVDVAATPASEVLLTKVVCRGSTLPAAEIDRAVAPFHGLPLTKDTLQKVAAAIGEVYARSDIAFYSVSIPGQVPTAGLLTLDATEGRVVEYHLANPTSSTPMKLIAGSMQRIMRDSPLKKSTLERALSILRDIPGQTVDVKVRQLPQQGELALDLTVKRKQLQIGLMLDNGGVANVVDGVQAQVSVTGNGLFRDGDTTRVSAYLPFNPDRYQYYSLSHTTPLGSNGLSLTATASHLRTKSRGLNILGRATTGGLTVSYPLVRSYKTNMTVSASLDGVDSSNYYLDIRFGDYKSRTARLGLSYSRLNTKTGYGLTTVVSQGLNALGAKAFTGFSDAKFTKVNAQAVVAHSLTPRLTAKMTVRGQYSNDKLPVTERFSLGGRGGGLAFRAGDITADRAAAGSLEVAWQLPAKSPVLQNVSLFTYVDGATGRSLARPAYNIAAQDYSLASAGGGARLALGKWTASAELAVPIKRPNERYSKAPRFLFGIGRAF